MKLTYVIELIAYHVWSLSCMAASYILYCMMENLFSVLPLFLFLCPVTPITEILEDYLQGYVSWWSALDYVLKREMDITKRFLPMDTIQRLWLNENG
jgi:hypothetical protein